MNDTMIQPGDTTYEVLEGTLAVELDGEKLEACPGDIVVVEPGVAHTWWNGGEGTLRFRCEVRPVRPFRSPATA